MLALPLQRGATADVKSSCSCFINQQFGDGAAETKFKKDIIGFQKARDDAVAVTNSSGEVGISNLSYIIYQLSAMAPRLSEYQGELRLSFAWLDAFKPTKKIDSNTLW